MNTFQDKVVVVTGAGKGIGRSIAIGFAEQGATVVIAETNKKNGQQVKDEIDTLSQTALFIQTDVSVLSQVEALMKKTEKKLGHIDVLINNAGLSQFYDPLEMDETTWDNILGTNLKGVFFCSREAAKVMKKQNGGSIVNIASTRALMSEPNSEAYAASKSGVLGLTHALAASLSKYQITVNAVLPGWIETVDYSALKISDHEQHFSKRVGKPEDIAHACLFLADTENNFITGAQLIIDGGMTRKMIYEE